MKFGILWNLPSPGVLTTHGFEPTGTFEANLNAYLAGAQEAEKLGYDSLFVSDHAFMSCDTWTLLSYVAAKTTKIRLGTGVTPIPRYVPAQLARVIASLDQLSNGRVIAGFGAGWSPLEFMTFAPGGVYDFPRERYAKTTEALRLMIKLWSQENVTFRGKYYWVMDVAAMLPRPVQQPHPPVWYGGTRPRTLENTAKYYDGWYCPTHGALGKEVAGVEGYEAKVKKIKEYAKKRNRDMSKFTFAVADGIQLSPAMIEKYVAAGCNYFIRGFRGKLEEQPNRMREFAKNVVPSFQ